MESRGTPHFKTKKRCFIKTASIPGWVGEQPMEIVIRHFKTNSKHNFIVKTTEREELLQDIGRMDGILQVAGQGKCPNSPGF